MRVLVCGSRTFTDERIIRLALFGAVAEAHALLGDLDVIHGGAQGADALAHQVAVNDLLDVEEYPADWDTHGKAAGPIRNQQMLDEGKPDLVLAFVDKPLAESRGTADMVRRARAAGVPTYVVEAR